MTSYPHKKKSSCRLLHVWVNTLQTHCVYGLDTVWTLFDQFELNTHNTFRSMRGCSGKCHTHKWTASALFILSSLSFITVVTPNSFLLLPFPSFIYPLSSFSLPLFNDPFFSVSYFLTSRFLLLQHFSNSSFLLASNSCSHPLLLALSLHDPSSWWSSNWIRCPMDTDSHTLGRTNRCTHTHTVQTTAGVMAEAPGVCIMMDYTCSHAHTTHTLHSLWNI